MKKISRYRPQRPPAVYNIFFIFQLISAMDFVLDCAVYGVPVPGNEGKAGMAAVVSKKMAKSELGKW